MPLKSRLLLFAWFFYFCSLPLFKSFANVAEVALVVLSLLPGTFSGFLPTVLRNKPVAALALIFGMLAFGLLHTQDLQNGWKVLKHAHRFVVIPLLFLAHARLLQAHFRPLMLSFILATCAACTFIIVLYYFVPEATVRELANSTKLMLPYPESVSRAGFGLYTPFIDRLQFGNLTAGAVLTCIFLWVQQYKRAWLAAAFPLLLFTLLILGGRGAQVALFISLLVFTVALAAAMLKTSAPGRSGSTTLRGLFVTGSLLVLLAIPYLSYKLLQPVRDRVDQTRWEIGLLRNNQYLQYDYQHFTTLRRLVSYRNMWEVVQQNPIIGVGTGDYHAELKKAFSRNSPDMPVHTHSQYLLYWAMTGILGLSLFLAVLGYWLLSLRRSGLVYFYGMAFLVYYLVIMLSDPLATQVDNMVFCSFLAFIGLLRHTSVFPTERTPAYA